MRFYSADVGQVLTFDILLDGQVSDLTPVGTLVDLLVNLDAPTIATEFSCTISGSPAGQATYTVEAGDFPTGSYTGQIRVKFSATRIFHSLPFGVVSKGLFS